jgi:hypothetical protein
MVYTSQSVPSTQVVSSVVAPAIPLPAQVAEEPFTGFRVLEDGVAAKTRVAKHKAARARIIPGWNLNLMARLALLAV